jgi:hypothetical protein
MLVWKILARPSQVRLIDEDWMQPRGVQEIKEARMRVQTYKITICGCTGGGKKKSTGKTGATKEELFGDGIRINLGLSISGVDQGVCGTVIVALRTFSS